MKITLTTQQRVAVVALYNSREPKPLAEQMISADVVEKISLSPEERSEWIHETPLGPGMVRVDLTASGAQSEPLEVELSKSEADDILGLFKLPKFTPADVVWARPLRKALEKES